MPEYDRQALKGLFADASAGDATSRFVRAVWFAFYLEDGRVDPDKDVSGGDLVELIGEMFERMGLTPDEEGPVLDG